MKIIEIIPQYIKAVGGPTFTVKSLESISKEVGDKVFILAGDKSKGVYNYVNQPFIRFISIFIILLKLRPDAIHLHGRLHLIFAPILYHIIHRNSKLIFTFHTQPVTHNYLPTRILLDHKSRSYSNILTPIISILLNKYFRITSVSSSIIYNINLLTSLKISNFDLVPSGARKVIFKQNETLQLSNDFFNIATIGVLQWDWKVKGHLILIEILSKLIKEGNSNIRLYIFGDGDYSRYIKENVKDLNIENNIILCGNMNITDMNLNQFNLYVHTGLNEGCSLALLEVIENTDLPVIVFDEGGNREAVNGISNIDVLKIDQIYAAIKTKIFDLHTKKEQANELNKNKLNKRVVQSWNNIYIKYYK